jgi:signal transduction histidine kinase
MYEELGLVTETGLIENYISEMTARNRDLLRYVVVADANGRVTHSNRWELLGRHFDRALGRDAIDRPSLAEIHTATWGERVLEIRTPLHISTRFWGSVAVGFSLVSIDQEVANLGKRAVLVALLLMLGNSILTALYVETLIRPILYLYQTMKRAGRGDLTARVRMKRGDEVGGLANAFDRMMDELEEAREREQVRLARLSHTEKMAAVGTLAAGVAHEVNNPVAGILTCIEAMRARPEDAELRRRYLDLIHDGIKRIEHIVLNLLDFSRPRELHAEPTSLNHNLRHVAELVDYQVRKHRVEVVFELDAAEPVVMADHFQMEQLFLNLVLNAILAMPEGGTLTLRTRTLGARVIAEVADTGVGIPAELLDRIFDPFFSTREVGEGTGLGLAVSYAIVEAHGGSIEVRSTVGRGSTFKVVLPVTRAVHEEVSQ